MYYESGTVVDIGLCSFGFAACALTRWQHVFAW